MEEIDKITDYIVELGKCRDDKDSDWISEEVRYKETLAVAGILELKESNADTENLRQIAKKLMEANEKHHQNTLLAIVACNKAIRETEGKEQKRFKRRLRKLKLIDDRQDCLNREILSILQNSEDKTKFQRLETKELENNKSTEPKTNMNKEYGEWMTPKEVSEYFKLSHRNVNNPQWRKENGIPFKQPGGYGCQVTFSKTEVEKWMKETKRR